MTGGPGPTVAACSVVLPTIGRPRLIRSCLESLARCEPRAAEILVVDSSDDAEVAEVVASFAGSGARTIPSAAAGLGAAFNLGLREAAHEVVLLTNDDCTVDASWVGAGAAHAASSPDALVTGRVLPSGEREAVPSTIEDPVATEHRGTPGFVLFTQCMALHRTDVLEFGGFDVDVRPSAEDNDLSYRWLRAGRRILYEPGFVVWHHDWRTREQLERLYFDYGVGQGIVYGKHLRNGDLRIARHVLRALVDGSRAGAARVVRGQREHPDPRLGLVRGLPTGIVRGWRIAARRGSGFR